MDKSKLIEEMFESAGKLPTLPGVAVKILEVVKKEDSDLMEIADIISSDPPLSAEVLKAANSPIYNLPSKVSTVPRAVNMLGINAVKNQLHWRLLPVHLMAERMDSITALSGKTPWPQPLLLNFLPRN